MSFIVAIDFEGTGLLKKDLFDPHLQPGIVEIGAIKLKVDELSGLYLERQYEFESCFQQILDPECFYEEEAQKITGITSADTYGKPNLREAFPKFAEFILGCKHLVTFNGIGYDIPLLQFNLAKYGLESKFPWPFVHHDLMKIANDVLNLQGKVGNKPPSLEELHAFLFDKPIEKHHRALEDATTTMRCAVSLWEKGYFKVQP